MQIIIDIRSFAIIPKKRDKRSERRGRERSQRGGPALLSEYDAERLDARLDEILSGDDHCIHMQSPFLHQQTMINNNKNK